MPPSKRDDLVDAAVRVFAREGFHATGIERVLEEAGVSRMTLYNHFKSKDDLILAALRRRDEQFRERLMRFVESAGTDPMARLLAVFDFHAKWFRERDFTGCTLFNATAEFPDPDCAIRRFVADSKRATVDYLRTLASAAGLESPDAVAEELNLILCGAVTAAHAISQAHDGDPAGPAKFAKDMAKRTIEAHRKQIEA